MSSFSFAGLKLPVMDVEMEDGSILHVNSPSVKSAAILTSIFDDGVTDQAVTDALAIFLSDNREGIKYKPEDFEQMPVVAQYKFVTEYYKFLTDTLAGKN